MGLRGPGANPAPLRKAKAEDAATNPGPLFAGFEPPASKPQAPEPWREPGLSRADRAIAFIETLPITQGSLAGTTMSLRPWQRRFVDDVYAEDARGQRPVRTAVLSMARKNGKTQLAAALALCHLCGPEAESRGEVYSAANDRFQAGKIFAEMVAIIEESEALKARLNVIRFRKEIECLVGDGKGSIFAALSADAATKHGLSPSFIVYDELGQAPKRDLYEALDTAMGARDNGRGQVVALHPFQQSTVAVERLPTGRLRYRVSGERGTEVFLEEEILHIRHRTRDGVMGLSPIAEARETFGLTLTMRDRATAQAEKGFSAMGALVFPGMINQTQHEQIKAKIQDAYVGTANIGNKVMVLDGGAKFEQFTIPNRDSEFLDSQKKSDLDICRIFGVPPSAVGITDNATYSNIGEESRALVVRCLAPLARRMEDAMNAALLTTETRKTLFIEHDLAGLLRGDMSARYEAYRIGREGEWLSANDVRDLENMSRIAGGDEYRSPSHRAANEPRPEAK